VESGNGSGGAAVAGNWWRVAGRRKSGKRKWGKSESGKRNGQSGRLKREKKKQRSE
jgi:hypothetical protein